MSSAEQHMSPAPSSLNGAHQTVPDESSLIATAVEDILDNFKSDLEANIEDLEANIEDHEVIMYYEYVFDSARELIWSAVRDEVTMTLKDEVANRKREGRTGGSIDDVTVYPQSVRLDEDLSIHFKDLSVYGEGWSGKQTCATLKIDSGLEPEGDSQKKEEEGEEQVVLLPYAFEWVSIT